MILHRYCVASLAMLVCLCIPGQSQAQFFKENSAAYLRTNPTFLKAFKEVVAKPSQSTVRVLCDGKDTALGMIVGPDGWILTKAYDLKGEITVKLRDGKVYEARWVGAQTLHDIALLKIEATGLSPVEFSESKQASAGNWLACVGLGEEPVAIGVVSVPTRVLPKSGLFVPPADLSKVGYLGVSLDKAVGDSHPHIALVQPSTPAAKIGLKEKDVVLALNDLAITEPEQFVKEIGKFKPGDVVTVKVRRGDVELAMKPTLDKRPSNFNFNRGEQQNKMGSELSSRRGGYPTVLQHDSVVKPADCGGPIVDLQGRVIGINICRAGRTDSLAVPSEVIQPFLFELISGRLPPKQEVAKLTAEQQLAALLKAIKKTESEKIDIDQRLAEAKTKLAKLEAVVKAAKSGEATATAKKPMPAVTTPAVAKVDDAAAQQIDKVVNLIQQRLLLMKDVASAKWHTKQTDADAKREQELLDQLVTQGQKLGIAAEIVRGFFTAQFDAAKQVQQAHFERFQKDKVELKNTPDLQKDLRPKLDQVSQELLTALVALQPHLASPAVQQRLRDRAAAIVTGDGINDAIRTRAIEPLFKK